jgi:glycosyltransferase involved in cell wall biosynthesis
LATITALICTRNRPSALLRAAQSLLQEPGSPLELIVVDQSDGDESQKLMRSMQDPRLVYVHSQSRGKGFALNEALRLARGEILVCTDDDCIAPSGWPSAMGRALEQQPRAALAFCKVVGVEHDHSLGYVPEFLPSHDRTLTRIREVVGGHGIGAGMALRRQVLLDLVGFDEMIGPGARFPSGDDWDLAHRVLLLGFEIAIVSGLSILHDGFRSFSEGREHTRRDWLAIGGVCAKPVRAGYFSALVVPFWEFFRNAVGPAIHASAKSFRPRGFTRISAFLEGFGKGLWTPVDSKKLLFRKRT